MGEINDGVNNWGNKPDGSHDGFVPNKPFKDVESKLPIMNYLKQSLSLLGNVSSPKITTKDDVETQRRPLPLHKRNEVMLRDILSVNHNSEEESPLESALMFNQVKQVPTLDKQLAAINDATKASVENLGVESDPIIIPRVPVTSDAESDSESDKESVSVVAFDAKDTNLDESLIEKTEDNESIKGNENNENTVEKEDEDYIPLEDYVKPPEPSISQNTMEFYLPSQQHAPLQTKEEVIMRNVIPRMNLLGVSPVIRGSLGRQKRQRLTMPHDVVQVSLTTPPVFNVDNVPLTLTHHVPSSNSRTFRTCEYFKHLEGKQKLLKEKRERLKKKYRIQLSKTEYPMTEELSIIDIKGNDPYKYSTDENSIEVETEHYLPRNISPESKTLKINDIEFEGDARTKDNRKCNHRRDSDSFFAVQYMTGSEMFERRLLPRPNAITKIHPRNSSASKGLMKTVRINDSSQHKKVRKYNSAPLERKVRPKSTDSFWESSRQKTLVKKVTSVGDVNVVTAEQKPKQVTRQLTKTNEKSVAENDKSKLSLKRPPVTMVSLKTPNIEKTIKVTVSKRDIPNETPGDKINTVPPNKTNTNKGGTKSTININEAKINKNRKQSRSSAISPKQISNKLLEFPKEQSKVELIGKSRQKTTKSVGRKRETVAMSNYRFKQNEFRDIQNKLKDENIMVSVNLIEKVLLENKTVL